MIQKKKLRIQRIHSNSICPALPIHFYLFAADLLAELTADLQWLICNG